MVASTYTYDVYGEPTVTGSQGNEFDFAGQQTDPSTGLPYLRARYYDPASGTFMSRDPLAASPNWVSASFAYAGSSPVTWSDPTGLCTGLECWHVWKKVSEEVLDSKKFDLHDLADFEAGWLTPITKKLKAKFGAGVCFEIESCEYRVTKRTFRNRVTGEEKVLIDRELFVNLKVGIGVGLGPLSACRGIITYDMRIHTLTSTDIGGRW